MEKNARLRGSLRAARVPLWALADALGISESTLIRRLRRELEPETVREYWAAFERIKATRQHEKKGA